ncbi:MAG: conjugal transfer protein TraF [Agarilytica sp.]
MKKLAVFLGLVSTQVFAIDGVNSGSSLTTGPSSNHFSMASAIHNPAMAPLVVPENERWRINYLPSISLAVEVGDVENFADDLDELVDLLEDPNADISDPSVTLDRFNDVLVRMGREGYLKQSVNISVPITPAYYHAKEANGTFFADLNIGAQASVQVIDSALSIDEQNLGYATDTSLYVKSGIENKLSFGYGREVLSDHKWVKGKAKLFAGVKLNIIQLELSKQITRLDDLDGQEVSDVLKDEYDKNLKSNTGIGIDVGVVWDADWYRVGLHIDNLNSPDFSYGDIGVNCDDLDVGTIERNSCEVTRTFVADGRIRSGEKHTKHAITRVDGLLHLTDRWGVTAALDLATYDDIVGFENQWLNLATTYTPKTSVIPAVRVGYQSNMAGTELAAYTFGFTFFKSVSLDFEWGTESVEVDGESVPRRLGASLAFEESF